MPDIFDEVEEDLRADRAQALLRRYGGVGIALLVLIVAATAGFELWQSRAQARRDAVATRFLAAARQADATAPTDRAAATQALTALGQAAPAGYAALASLRLAALHATEGDAAGAIAAYDRVAADTAAPRLLRDLATLRSVQAQLATGQPATLRSRLATIETPDGTWRAQAQETEALIDLRANDTKAAIAVLQRLAADVTASRNTRGRASGLLQSLGVQPTATGASPE